MAALYRYDIVVLDTTATKERDEAMWEMGRGGWELIQVLAGDWKNGKPTDTTKMSWFVRRQATHDINF